MAGTGWDPAGVDASVTISEGGQKATRSSGGNYNSCAVRGLAGRSRGRRYFEITPNTGSYASFVSVGFMGAEASLGPFYQLGAGNEIQGGWRPASGQFYYSYPSGDKGARDSGPQYSAGVLGVLIDFDTKQCFIYLDGVLRVTEAMNIPNDTVLFPACALYSTSSVSTGATLQTVEPFQYPPEVTFMAWDISDESLISKVSGLMKIEGVPVRRTLKAFSFERMTYLINGSTISESKPLGQTISDESGQYEIILRDGFPREVFVVAFDDYGESFKGGLSVTPGYRVHPTVPTGLVYECDGAGVLPEDEPVWPVSTEASHLVGTASFMALPFYRPEVNGPIMPEIFEAGYDPHWDKVVALLHFDGNLTDQTGRIWTARGGAEPSDVQYQFGGGSLYVPTSTRAGLYHPASPDFALSQADYTIEMFVFPVGSDDKWFLEIGSGSGWTSRFWLDRRDGKLRVAGGPSIATWVHNGIIPDNEQSHIAVTIEGTLLRAFVRGVLVGSASITGQIPAGNLAVGVGHTLPSTTAFTEQFIDEVRITRGLARYTGNFTPPISSFPGFGSFSPRDIAPALWLDAADSGSATLVSGAVSTWLDKSTNGRNFSNSTASARPSVLDGELNGLRVLRFDGTNDALIASSTEARNIFSNVSEGWVFAVARRRAATSKSAPIIVIETSPGENRFTAYAGSTAVGYETAGSLVSRRLDSDSAHVVRNTESFGTEWAILAFRRSWGMGTSGISVNGGAEQANTTTDPGSTENTLSRQLRIGWVGSSDYADIDLAEIVAIGGNDSLPSADGDRVVGYLAWKWGLVEKLPTNHPYKFVRPLSAAV